MPNSTPLVLVADDEPSMLELVVRHLRTMTDPRVDVIQASDGDTAWRLALEHLPDLVVLDVMMPGMSGWEVCRKIRENVALDHTGVIMLTGIGENLNQLTSPLYGADSYIDKPFEFDMFDEKVKETLSAHAAQRDAVARPLMNGVVGETAVKPKGVKKAVLREAPKAVSAPKKKAKPAKKVAAKKAPAKKAVATKSAKKSKSASLKKVAPKAAKVATKKAPKKAAKKIAKKIVKSAPKKKAVAKKAPAKKVAPKKSAPKKKSGKKR